MKRLLRDENIINYLFLFDYAAPWIIYDKHRGAPLATENGVEKLLQAWERAAGGAIRIEITAREKFRLWFQVRLN